MPSRAFIDSDVERVVPVPVQFDSVLMPSRAFIDSDIIQRTLHDEITIGMS